MDFLHAHWHRYVNKGIAPHHDFFTQLRVRLLNIALGFTLFAVVPFFGTYYLIRQETDYLWPYALGSTFIGVCLVLNRSGRHTLAVVMAAICVYMTTLGLVWNTDVQLAAPYNLMVMAVVAYCTISDRFWRTFVGLASAGGFLYTLYDQQRRNLPFEPAEFVVIAAFMLFILFVLRVFVEEYERYQRLVNEQNLQLREQNDLLALQNRTIEQQAEELVALGEAKVRFFEHISHEFRTPLALLLGGIQQASRTGSPEAQQSLLAIADKHGRLLQRLIDQLLDVAKSAEHAPVCLPKRQDAVGFLREAMRSFGELAQERGLQWQFESRLPGLQMAFDADWLMKICNNLLSNALRFTPAGGCVSMRVEQEEGWMLVEVSDTGVGIPPESLPHIFERFYQTPGRRQYGGTGIGLALVKELVAAHQGDISVASRVGEGTVFRLRLPAGLAEAPGQAVTAPAPTPPLPAAEEAKPMLLLVEDHEDLHELLGQALADRYQVLHAYNGLQGMEMALAQVPDVVLSDVMMPGSSGLELCQRLKDDERTSHIPVVLLTARTALEDRLSGLEALADDYMPKPFDLRELEARLHALIENRRRLAKKLASDAKEGPKLDIHPKDAAFLARCEQVLEGHYADSLFGAEQFADALALSHRQLNRKLQAVAGCSLMQYVQAFRLRKAAGLLAHTDQLVGEVAYATGFGSPAYFVKCFREKYGTTPKEYRDRLVEGH